MMELWRETILGTVITELSAFFAVSELEFLQRYEKLFGFYADWPALKEMLENGVQGEYQKIIQRAKKLALGGEDPHRERAAMNPLCSVFSNLSLDGNYSSVIKVRKQGQSRWSGFFHFPRRNVVKIHNRPECSLKYL